MLALRKNNEIDIHFSHKTNAGSYDPVKTDANTEGDETSAAIFLLTQKVDSLQKVIICSFAILLSLIVATFIFEHTFYQNQHPDQSPIFPPQLSINSSLLPIITRQAQNPLSSSRNPPQSSNSPRSIPPNPYEFCDYVFIDCGSNRGDNIEAFAGDKINEEITETKDSIFNTYNVTKNDFCVFGFEGNPFHTPNLQEKEKKYKTHFRFLKIFYETVISDTEGKLKLYTDNGHYHEGSSISADKTTLGINADRFEIVDSIDFAKFLKSFSGAKVIFIKMDVEGAEFGIISEGLAQGSLCIDDIKFYIAIEYHIGKKASPPAYRNIENSFGDVVETILREQCDVDWFHIKE